MLPVVSQDYVTRVHDEDVLKGNSALLKCVIPSFVADFVSVRNWVDNKGNTFSISDSYGNLVVLFRTIRGFANVFINYYFQKMR